MNTYKEKEKKKKNNTEIEMNDILEVLTNGGWPRWHFKWFTTLYFKRGP